MNADKRKNSVIQQLTTSKILHGSHRVLQQGSISAVTRAITMLHQVNAPAAWCTVTDSQSGKLTTEVMLQKPKQRLTTGNACTCYQCTGYGTIAITIRMYGDQIRCHLTGWRCCCHRLRCYPGVPCVCSAAAAGVLAVVILAGWSSHAGMMPISGGR